MKFFRWFVGSSFNEISSGDKIKFEKNSLVSGLRDEPSEFEATFIHDDELFQYGFRLDNERVHEEWLFARHSKHGSRMRTIFHRALVEADEDKYEWEINETQVPGKRETWKESTRSNALFLSVAVQLNSASLVKPFNWIRNNLHIISTNDRFDEDFTAMALKDSESREKVIKLMSALDLKIGGFRVETEKRALPEEFSELFSPNAIEQIQSDMEGELDYRVYAQHRDDNDKIVEIGLKRESDGTQAIFGVAGPIFDVLENGYTLVIDELSNSLHPMALRALVKIFHDVSLNKNGAQLIFTSHETSIISNDLLHRDQIWFIERSDGISSVLTPLSDYNVRDVLAYERAYLGGKFGAIPNVSKFGYQRLDHGFEE
ncbi:AAA family ATPase [Maritalea sp.]|uniref:AAA family ATPase n=1 Tax=Maritalea sp. TaxID=2003361 RepID=UPI003EF2B193